MIVWWLRGGMGILVLVLLTACATSGGEPPAAQLEFRATGEIGADQQLHVTLEIYNAGEQAFPGDENLAAAMELVDSTGVVRAQVRVSTVESLSPGESAWPATWQGHVDPGRYVLRWGASRYEGASETELLITSSDAGLFLGGEPTRSPATQNDGAVATGAPTPAASERTPTSSPSSAVTPVPTTAVTPEATSAPAENADPTATPLIALARQDLSERLNIPPETIVLVAVQPETFSDTSLGMPLPGQSYAQVLTPGYAIYFQADGVTYTYNAGAGHVVPADGEG